MTDQFVVTESTGWVSRLVGSIKGVLVGLVFFAGAFPLLFWNEGRAVRRAQDLEEGRGAVVLAGCEAHVCLLQTALELLQEDFEVWVVTDACGSRTERNRDAAFDRLAGAGCELVSTEMVAFEWLRSASHPAFKAVQALIK